MADNRGRLEHRILLTPAMKNDKQFQQYGSA
jgi:hypothetical protein